MVQPVKGVIMSEQEKLLLKQSVFFFIFLSFLCVTILEGSLIFFRLGLFVSQLCRSAGEVLRSESREEDHRQGGADTPVFDHQDQVVHITPCITGTSEVPMKIERKEIFLAFGENKV